MKEKNKKAAGKIALTFFLVLLIGAIIIIVFLLTNTSETRTSIDKQSDASEYIRCTAINPSDQFFKLRATPVSTNHEIKVTFHGDNLDRIFYSFHSEYDAHSGATMTEFDIMSEYDKYVESVGLDRNVLSPNVSSSDTNSTDASFYVEGDRLKPALVPIFFLDKDEYSAVGGNLKGYLLRNYESKGFSCEQN